MAAKGSMRESEIRLGRTLQRLAVKWGDRQVWMLNLLRFKNPYPGAGADSCVAPATISR